MQTNKLEENYNMLDWWKKVVFDNYANFEGRARRSEYWYFGLMNLLLLIVPIIIMFTGIESGGTLYYIGLVLVVLAGLVLFIPSLAVAVRRLHDTGKSGWWYLIGVIPIVSYIGGIVLLVFYCSDSQAGSNKWGPNPKEGHFDEINEIGTE